MEAWLIAKLEQARKAKEHRDAERPSIPLPVYSPKEIPIKV